MDNRDDLDWLPPELDERRKTAEERDAAQAARTGVEFNRFGKEKKQKKHKKAKRRHPAYRKPAIIALCACAALQAVQLLLKLTDKAVLTGGFVEIAKNTAMAAALLLTCLLLFSPFPKKARRWFMLFLYVFNCAVWLGIYWLTEMGGDLSPEKQAEQVLYALMLLLLLPFTWLALGALRRKNNERAGAVLSMVIVALQIGGRFTGGQEPSTTLAETLLASFGFAALAAALWCWPLNTTALLQKEPDSDEATE